MKKDIPPITVLVVTLNNKRTLLECLSRIQRQEYPKEKIEYLAVDGGSTDGTVDILKHYGFTVIISPYPRDAEAQRGVGIAKAKHNLIVSLDADNYLPTDKWFVQMTQPFIDDPTVIHAHTMHYSYVRSETIFNRYVGLFGMADPVVYYVGRPDRIPQTQNKWTTGNIVKETTNYYLVDFDLSTLPTVGCNGVVYRRDFLLKDAHAAPSDFLHIDVFADLIHAGHTRFAIVKNDVIHSTATNLYHLMQKRIHFLDAYYLPMTKKRRYLIYDPSKLADKIKLGFFVLYTITFIKPLFDSFVGFLVIQDVAWFVHPIVCWIYLLSYGQAAFKSATKK